MSLFKNLTNEGLEETQDRLGGFSRLETDVYAGTIKVAFAGQATSGAQNVTLILALENGQEYRETVYITDKTGKNYFLNKQDNTKKVPLPGFTIVDDLCMVTTDKPLAEQSTEEKVVNVWDPDQKKEMPKSVPVLVELTGKPCLVAILRSIVNKNEKQGNEYVATADTREENTIEKVFHPTLRITVPEARAGKTEAGFIDSWLERNKGKDRDKRTVKDGDGGKAGRPGQAAGPPQAGASGAAPRKSLFGN